MTLIADIIRLKDEGRSWSAIGDTVGKSRDVVRRLWQKNAGKELPEESQLEEWLKPIVKPAPKPLPAIYTAATIDVIGSDLHFPLSSKPSEAVFLETIKRLRPENVYLNGDIFDLMALSRFDVDYRKGFHFTPQDECDAGANFLWRLETILQEFNGNLIALPGNHEARWLAYLNKNAPQVVAMGRASELLSFKNWWIPKWSRLQLLEDDIVVMPDSEDPLLITHGEIVRTGGGMSARGHGLKYFSSVIHGHSHRLGLSAIRVPSIGNRPERMIRAYESGCLADLCPSYSKKPDWCQGFGIIMRDEAAQSWNVELVPISNGKATVNTLGGTIQADQ